MKQTIDTYKLTSMEEPSDEILSQIMREAAEDARKSNEEATERYFNQMLMEVRKIAALWTLSFMWRCSWYLVTRIVNDDNNITIFSLIGRKDLMANSYLK